MNGAALIPSTPPDLVLSSSLAVLEHASTVDEVKQLRDQAGVMEKGLKLEIRALQTIGADTLAKRNEAAERQNDWAEVKLRAERRLGGFLSDLRPRGRWLREGITGRMRGAARTLPEGISPRESDRLRRIAALPVENFEKWISETRAARMELTRAALLRAAEEHVANERAANARALADAAALGDAEVTTCDGESIDGPPIDGAAEHTRPLRLFPTGTQRQQLLNWCRELALHHGTSNLTSTIIEIVRSKYEDLHRSSNS